MAPKTNDKEELFETYPIPKAVAFLAVPMVLSSLMSILYSLSDTYFVGLLNKPVQTASVTLAAPVLLAFNSINNLFGVGCSSMMSRALGRKDYDTVRRCSAFGFYGALICGILFAIFCTVGRMPLLKLLGADADTITATSAYLNWTVSIGAIPAILNMVMASMIRSEGAALHASIGIMIGFFLNIILDPFFILPQWLGMQAEGAAIATLLSNCAAHVYFLSYLYLRRGRTNVCILPGYFSLRKDIVAGVFTVGIPALIQNILNVFSSIILNSLASVHGATALAAMGICIRINMVPMYIAMGISRGIMPLIGYSYASKNIFRMKTALIFTTRISLFLLILASIFFFCYPGFFVRQFIADGETVALGTKFLRVFSLALPFFCLDFLAVITFQAIGKGKEALIFALMRKLVFELPLLYLMNWLFPLYGLPYALPIAEIMMTMIASLVIVRFFQREPMIFERKKTHALNV